jgi:hypothetical protein
VKVCFNITGIETDSIFANSSMGLARLNTRGCADVYSGSVSIASTRPNIVCKPDRILISPRTSEQVQVACFISPAGVWSGQPGSTVISVAGSEWNIAEGLQQSPYGWIVGTLSGTPPVLDMNGRTQTGQTIGGKVTVAAHTLSGRLLIEGLPWQMELTR